MAETIKTLITAGLDAFVNLYDVDVVLPDKVVRSTINGIADSTFQTNNTNKLKTRIGNFQPPESSLGEYSVYYQSGSLTRQNAKIALNRVITLPFRIDASFDIYRILKAWQSLYLGTNQADYHLPDPKEDDYDNYFGEIKVAAYNSDTMTTDAASGELQTKAIWTFQKVMCIDVAEPQFGRDSANPVEVVGTFLYYFLIPPTYPSTASINAANLSHIS